MHNLSSLRDTPQMNLQQECCHLISVLSSNYHIVPHHRGQTSRIVSWTGSCCIHLVIAPQTPGWERRLPQSSPMHQLPRWDCSSPVGTTVRVMLWLPFQTSSPLPSPDHPFSSCKQRRPFLHKLQAHPCIDTSRAPTPPVKCSQTPQQEKQR